MRIYRSKIYLSLAWLQRYHTLWFVIFSFQINFNWSPGNRSGMTHFSFSWSRFELTLTAALKGSYGNHKSPAVQVFVTPPTTGGQTQRLKQDWFTREKTLSKQSITSEASRLGKAPMVSMVTLRDPCPKCSFELSSMFSNGAAISSRCWNTDLGQNTSDFGAVTWPLCFYILGLQGLQEEECLWMPVTKANNLCRVWWQDTL